MIFKIKDIMTKVRNIKQKLSHDNLFDISLGAILSLIGLSLYRYADWDKLSIIIVPFLVSWFNELVNARQSKRFGWIDLGFRCLIGTLLYFIL